MAFLQDIKRPLPPGLFVHGIDGPYLVSEILAAGLADATVMQLHQSFSNKDSIILASYKVHTY